jgi:hypothetical protein
MKLNYSLEYNPEPYTYNVGWVAWPSDIWNNYVHHLGGDNSFCYFDNQLLNLIS